MAAPILWAPGMLCCFCRKTSLPIQFLVLRGGGGESCGGRRGGGGGKCQFYPKGPKIEKIQDRPPGLKFSSEIENFSSEPPTRTLFSVGNSESPGLKISSEIENFKRD